MHERKESKNVAKKKELVSALSEKIKSSKSILLIDYKGINVKEDTELRNEFRKAGIEYKVYKNTMVRRAFNALNIKDFDNDLNGTTSFAFSSKDEVTSAKLFTGNAKKLNDKIKAKSAFVSGKYLNPSEVKALAAIPSKEALIASMLGSLNAPATNLVGVLSATMRGLVVALNAIAEKKAN